MTWIGLENMDTYDLKDSGTRRQFDTGAKRDGATGKGRYDLLSPLALRRLAVLLEKGAVKYDARNWEKGMPLSVFLDCAFRHLYRHLEGMRDEDHLAAAMWNVQAMMHHEEMIARGLRDASLNDLPTYVRAEDDLDAIEAILDPTYHVEVSVPVEGTEPTWVEQGKGRLTESVAIGAAKHLLDQGDYRQVRVVQGDRVILELSR